MAQSTLVKPEVKQVSAARWFYQQLKQAGFPENLKVKTQQRGNTLHILLEGEPCPEQSKSLEVLAESLMQGAKDNAVPPQAFLQQHLPTTTSPVYRLLIYGRSVSSIHGATQNTPQWSKPVDMAQLERLPAWARRQRRSQGSHLSSLTSKALTGQPSSPDGRTREAEIGALMISSRTQAKEGDPDAIARYLSEMLSHLGISVRAAVKPATDPAEGHIEEHRVSRAATRVASNTPHESLLRLWVLFETSYSLDATAISKQIVSLLRSLDLDQFQDAAIFSQVRGESRPDWALRIDLTPKQDLLRHWARWGDAEAIARLLNEALRPIHCAVTAQAQNKSLQIFCRSLASTATSRTAIDPSPPYPINASEVRRIVSQLLEEIAPQGLHAATLYGAGNAKAQRPSGTQLTDVTREVQVGSVSSQTEQPGDAGDAGQWVEWLTLPAATHPELSEPALELAEKGDLAAASFLLGRILNPDLDEQLQSGGIRLQLLRRGDLLHVMCDALICPSRKRVGRPTIKYLRQLRLPRVSGVRVYGRRAGQVQPRWQYGRDFVPRQDDVVDSLPKFQVTEARNEDLLTDDPVELGAEQAPWPGLQGVEWVRPSSRVFQRGLEAMRQGLVKTQLFRSRSVSGLQQPDLSFSQADDVLPNTRSKRRVGLIWVALGFATALSGDLILGQTLRQADQAPVELASTPNALGDRLLEAASQREPSRSSSFVQQPRVSSEQQAAIARLQSNYPGFNNALFNEKLALYRQRVMTEGAPDILIVGSSRALRGVDPSALTRGLADVGYPDLSIFNFSINGSTAQVVELQLALLLDPQYRPGLILWADGARAFNSGRRDATYTAIQDSPAYRRFAKGNLPPLFGNNEVGSLASQGAVSSRWIAVAEQATGLFSVQDFDNWLDESVGRWSSTHGQRDRIQDYLTNRFAESVTDLQRNTGFEPFNHANLVPDAPEGEGIIDFDGFMPLSIRFNPATYYQRYSKVTGQYDGDYQRFRLDGTQKRALDNVVMMTQSQQIPLVFVNLPLTTDYLDPVRSRYERVFQKEMFRRMTQRQLIFRDLSELWPARVDNFSDPSHLNRYGALQVSNHLSEDPLIPWPQVIRN